MFIDNSYDPGSPGKKGSLYGLPYSAEEAKCVIIPVPWDVTVSYGAGTSAGPRAVLEASPQLDLEVPGIVDSWKMGLAMTKTLPGLERQNITLRNKADAYIKSLEKDDLDTAMRRFESVLSDVNNGTEDLRSQIYNESSGWIAKGKLVGLLGGDHSCPLGFIQALGEVHESFGILQLDAHMDLRKAYEGFEHSHASIMYNVVQCSAVERLIQVGIRDYSAEERLFADASDVIEVFYDAELKERQFHGDTWARITHDILKSLPDKVYISFDVDGLDPKLCPGTGTPVPGGMSFDESLFLIREIVRSGRKIIGFDLCEVAPQENDREWNANVGARILYQLACWAGVSNGLLSQGS